MGAFDRAATERATTPRATSEGIVTSRNEVRDPRKSAYWTVRSAPGGRSNISRSSAPHSKAPRISLEQSELPRGAPRVGLALRRALELERLRLRDHRAHREDPDPVLRPRERDLVAAAGAGTNSDPWTPAMRACEGPLKSASRIAIRSPRARRAPARCSVKVLLPTPPLPEPTATRWRTPASPSVMRARCSATCSRTLDPPSPTMSW